SHRAVDARTRGRAHPPALRGALPPQLPGRAAAQVGHDAPAPAHTGSGAGRRVGGGVAQARLAPHQKGARRRGAVVTFLDETGSTFRARVGTTWAPTGAAPVLKRVERHRREVSSLVALTAPLSHEEQPHLYARHVEGTIHGREVVEMLRYL